MEMEVLELEHMHCASERRSDGPRVVRKDQWAIAKSSPTFNDLPSLTRQLESPVIAKLTAGVLDVSEEGGSSLGVEVFPTEPSYFFLAPGRRQSEAHYVHHWDLSSTVSLGEIVEQLAFFFGREASLALLGLRNDSLATQEIGGLIHSLQWGWQSKNRGSGFEDRAKPDQIVTRCRGTSTACPPGLDVVDEVLPSQGVYTSVL